jgi:hypothetical protein
VAHARRRHHPQSVPALAGPADEGLTTSSNRHILERCLWNCRTRNHDQLHKPDSANSDTCIVARQSCGARRLWRDRRLPDRSRAMIFASKNAVGHLQPAAAVACRRDFRK